MLPVYCKGKILSMYFMIIFLSQRKLFSKLDGITFVGFKNYFFQTYLQLFVSSKISFLGAYMLNARMFEFEIRVRDKSLQQDKEKGSTSMCLVGSFIKR